MAQIKIFGERHHIAMHRRLLSDIIHKTVVEVLGLPEDKRFHRFIPLEAEDLIHPADRSGVYTIIEISMFEGRGAAIKHTLLKRLMEVLQQEAHLPISDVEITIFETPRANWGIRGKTGDELTLDYEVER